MSDGRPPPLTDAMLLAAAWAEGINHVAILAIPKAVAAAASGPGFQEHLVATIQSLGATAISMPQLPGNGPGLAAKLDRLLQLVLTDGVSSAAVAALAREICEGTGLVRPGDWSELERQIDGALRGA